MLNESDGALSWSIYSIASGVGRAYYGWVDTNANPANPVIVFNAPTVDLPDSIQFGRTWTRSVDWMDVLDIGFQLQIAIHFTSEARVDAYGTVLLPEIGEVPALRVNEVNTYQSTDLTFGFPIPDQHFRNFYWLVRGIGKAVHVISPGFTSVPPEDLTTAKTVLRVFEASDVVVPAEPRAVVGLHIQSQNGLVTLSWEADTNATSYCLETIGDFSENWNIRTNLEVNLWSEPMPVAERQRFYRVWIKP